VSVDMDVVGVMAAYLLQLDKLGVPWCVCTAQSREALSTNYIFVHLLDNKVF